MKIFKMMDESSKLLIAYIAMAILLLCLFLCIGRMLWIEGVIVGGYHIIYVVVIMLVLRMLVLRIRERTYRISGFLLCVLAFLLSLYCFNLAQEKTDAILTTLKNIERLLELDKDNN